MAVPGSYLSVTMELERVAGAPARGAAADRDRAGEADGGPPGGGLMLHLPKCVVPPIEGTCSLKHCSRGRLQRGQRACRVLPIRSSRFQPMAYAILGEAGGP